MSTDKQASPKDSEVKTREHPFLCLEDFQAANGRLYLKSHAYERIPDDSRFGRFFRPLTDEEMIIYETAVNMRRPEYFSLVQRRDRRIFPVDVIG